MNKHVSCVVDFFAAKDDGTFPGRCPMPDIWQKLAFCSYAEISQKVHLCNLAPPHRRYYNLPQIPLEIWRSPRCESDTSPSQRIPLLAIFSAGDNAECLSINLSRSRPPQLRPNLIIFSARPNFLYNIEITVLNILAKTLPKNKF